MKTTVNEQDLMTVRQAAQVLNVSEIWVRKLADKGTLKCLRVPEGPRLLFRQSVEQLRKKREQVSA